MDDKPWPPNGLQFLNSQEMIDIVIVFRREETEITPLPQILNLDVAASLPRSSHWCRSNCSRKRSWSLFHRDVHGSLSDSPAVRAIELSYAAYSVSKISSSPPRWNWNSPCHDEMLDPLPPDRTTQHQKIPSPDWFIKQTIRLCSLVVPDTVGLHPNFLIPTTWR